MHIPLSPSPLLPSLFRQSPQVLGGRPGPLDPCGSALVRPGRTTEGSLIPISILILSSGGLVVLRPMGVGVERVFHDPVFGQGGVRGETFEFAFPGVFFGFDVFVFFTSR